MGQRFASCAPSFHTRRMRNNARLSRQRLPHGQQSAAEFPSLSASTRALPLLRRARFSFSLLVAVLLVVVQPQSGAIQEDQRLFPFTPSVEAMPVRGRPRAAVGGGPRRDEESLEAASSGGALYPEEQLAGTGTNPAAAVVTTAVKPASSSWSTRGGARAAASPHSASVNTAAADSISDYGRSAHVKFHAVVAPAAWSVGDWNQAAATVSTRVPWEQQQEQQGTATKAFENAAAAPSERKDTRLLAPAGADIASAEEQEAAAAIEPVLGTGAAAEGTRHNSASHPQQPTGSVLGPRAAAGAAAAGVPPTVAAAMPRTSLPAAALLTRMATAHPQPSGKTSSNRSSTQTGGSTSSSAAAADVGAGPPQRRRQQSVQRHTQQQDSQERSKSSAAFVHPQQPEARRKQEEQSSAGAAAMLSPFSSAYDRGYEDDGEEEMGLTSSQGFGQKLREAISSPASKILIGIGGAVAVGTLGVKYTRALLKRRRRQKLQQRPPTPFSDLLGHVLLAHEEEQAAAEEAVEGVLRSAKGKWGNSSSSSRIVEAATADVLGDPGSVTALYFTSSAVEEMLQQRGYLPFTTRLEAIAAGCKRRGQKLQVVYVSADADSSDAAKHFAQMPWYAVPYDDAEGQEIAQRLYRRFRVSTLPHVVLLDSEARVINPQAYASMLMDPAAFPWKKKTLRELLGDTLIRPDGETVDRAALDNKVLGLYFSASWCPPCQAFTPNLVNAAQQLREQGKNFEVVFISNDKNQQQFDEYFKKMTSFLAVPFKETNKRALLQETLNVRSLPTLVWVGPDDEVLTRSGVAALAADAELKSFPFREPDVHEVAETVEGIAQEPALILFMEYANPADQQKQQAALEAAATALRGQKRDGGFPPVPLLFTARKISPRSTALRRICKQHEVFASGDLHAARQQQAPVMVIVDLIDQSYYLYKRPASTGTVDETPYFTADEITTFVRGFRSETLERNPLVLPE